CILGWFLYTTSIKDIVTIVSRGRHEKEREPVLHGRGGEVSEHFQADADLLRQGGAVPPRLGGPGKRLPLLQRQPAGLSGHHPDHEADRLFAAGDQGPYAALRPGQQRSEERRVGKECRVGWGREDEERKTRDERKDGRRGR